MLGMFVGTRCAFRRVFFKSIFAIAAGVFLRGLGGIGGAGTNGTRAYGDQSIPAQTIVSFGLQEHTVTRTRMPEP